MLSRFFHTHGLFHGLSLRRHPVIRQVLPAPVLINFGVEMQLPHAYAAEGSCDRDAKCDPPYDLEGLSEDVSYFASERLLQRRNDRDRRECDLDALREPL